MNKLEDVLKMIKANDLLHEKEEENKCCKKVLWILAIIGAMITVALVIYAVYRYFTPDYLEDFEDEDEDDFEEDDEDEEEDLFVDESESKE